MTEEAKRKSIVDSQKCFPYPNVPMTRVETWVLLSEESFASPKSATYTYSESNCGKRRNNDRN